MDQSALVASEIPAERRRTHGFDAVIVIFGAAVRPDGQPSAVLRQRVDAALRHGGGCARPLYIPTGGVGRYGPAEAVVMQALLEQQDVLVEAIVVEDTATDTLSSVRAVRRILNRLGRRGAVRVATSAYHLPRCLLLCWLAGLHARPCQPPAEPASRRYSRRWYWRLRELLAVPYDTVLVIALRLCGRI